MHFHIRHVKVIRLKCVLGSGIDSAVDSRNLGRVQDFVMSLSESHSLRLKHPCCTAKSFAKSQSSIETISAVPQDVILIVAQIAIAFCT